MTTALLLAAAVLVLPTTSTAAERLSALLPVHTTRVRPARAVAASAGVMRRLLDGATAGPTDRDDPETMYRLLRLLAVALRAGLTPQQALSAVADALQPVGDGTPRFERVARALRAAAGRIQLGTPVAKACDEADPAGVLRPIGEVLDRAVTGGSGAGPALEHAAERLHAEVASAAQARVERAGVLVAGPLGLCFLPAFICLGVIPIVIGLAGDIL